MRLLCVISIVTLYVTINSHADSGPHKEHEHKTIQNHANHKSSLSEDEQKQSLEFVMNLARNFSSFYFQKMTEFVGNDRIVSPISIFLTMSMLSYGAHGQSRSNLLNAIGLSHDKTKMAKAGYKNYLDKLSKYDVHIKTKIFVPPGVKLNSHFIALSKKVFHSEIEEANVTDGFMDSEKINEWVAAQTNNNVTALFKPQNIGRDPNILFVNTVYFNGNWKKAFDKSRTTQRMFHMLNGNSFAVQTMHTVDRFSHGRLDDLKASFIELPYKSNSEDDAMSMFILLPDTQEHKEWTYLVYGLRNMNLTRLLNSTEKEVELYLPKFKIESELSLNDVLDRIMKPEFSFTDDRINRPLSVNEFREQMFLSLKLSDKVIGMTSDKSGATNLSRVFESSKLSRLGKTAMKIVIEVNEEGQQTAGAHGVSYNTMGSTPSDRKTRSIISEAVKFIVDRPFVAIIATKGRILTDIFSINFTGKTYWKNRPKKRSHHHKKKKPQHNLIEW